MERIIDKSPAGLMQSALYGNQLLHIRPLEILKDLRKDYKSYYEDKPRHSWLVKRLYNLYRERRATDNKLEYSMLGCVEADIQSFPLDILNFRTLNTFIASVENARVKRELPKRYLQGVKYRNQLESSLAVQNFFTRVNSAGYSAKSNCRSSIKIVADVLKKVRQINTEHNEKENITFLEKEYLTIPKLTKDFDSAIKDTDNSEQEKESIYLAAERHLGLLASNPVAARFICHDLKEEKLKEMVPSFEDREEILTQAELTVNLSEHADGLDKIVEFLYQQAYLDDIKQNTTYIEPE